MWVKFVDTHRANLIPLAVLQFVMHTIFSKRVSKGFTGTQGGLLRRLKLHAYPTIWRPKTITKSGVKEKSSLPMLIIK